MRTASRSPVTLKIKFKSTTLEQFIERYSVDISHGGIFIRTKDPLPVGTNLRFEFQLKDASPLITGDGTVVWTRDFDPTRSGVAPGMGVRFDRLPSESQDVLEQILAHKTAKLGKPPEAGFLDMPTKVAFGNVPTRVTPKEMLEGLAQGGETRRTLLGVTPPIQPALPAQPKSEDTTPLPPALPYHNELDEFPDEAFEEATKVAALEGLARRSAENEAQVEDASPPLPPFGKSLDDDVTQQRRGRVTPPRQSAPEEIQLRHPIRDTDPGPPAVVAPAKPPTGPQAIFHDLPARSPFAGNGSNGRAARDSNDATTQEDPFSLPAERGDAGPTRSARSLRVVDTPAPEAPAEAEADDDAEVTDESVDVSAEPGPDAALAAPKKEEERDGSSMPWIAAAAVILLGGAIGGFLLLSGRKEEPATATAKAEPPPAAATAPASVERAPAPRPEPPAPATAPLAGVDVTVTSEPPGATAELVGASQSGPTPITFRALVAGQSYQVKLRKAGFLASELTMKPEAGNPPAVKLEAKPSVLHVVSEPPGAQVWINGRRQRSLTPADVELPSRITDRKKLMLSVRKSGYANGEQIVTLDGMAERGDSMVQEVSLVLRQQVAPTPAEPKESEDPEGGTKPDRETEEPAEPASGDKPAEPASGDKPDKPAEPAEPDKPSEGGGGEDKSESKPEGAAKPAPSEGAVTGEREDPIPDWMKPK
jgi:uncharacterized protein (TIGR02266 family)